MLKINVLHWRRWLTLDTDDLATLGPFPQTLWVCVCVVVVVVVSCVLLLLFYFTPFISHQVIAHGCKKVCVVVNFS